MMAEPRIVFALYWPAFKWIDLDLLPNLPLATRNFCSGYASRLGYMAISVVVSPLWFAIIVIARLIHLARR